MDSSESAAEPQFNSLPALVRFLRGPNAPVVNLANGVCLAYNRPLPFSWMLYAVTNDNWEDCISVYWTDDRNNEGDGAAIATAVARVLQLPDSYYCQVLIYPYNSQNQAVVPVYWTRRQLRQIVEKDNRDIAFYRCSFNTEQSLALFEASPAFDTTSKALSVSLSLHRCILDEAAVAQSLKANPNGLPKYLTLDQTIQNTHQFFDLWNNDCPTSICQGLTLIRFRTLDTADAANLSHAAVDCLRLGGHCYFNSQESLLHFATCKSFRPRSLELSWRHHMDILQNLSLSPLRELRITGSISTRARLTCLKNLLQRNTTLQALHICTLPDDANHFWHILPSNLRCLTVQSSSTDGSNRLASWPLAKVFQKIPHLQLKFAWDSKLSHKVRSIQYNNLLSRCKQSYQELLLQECLVQNRNRPEQMYQLLISHCNLLVHGKRF